MKMRTKRKGIIAAMLIALLCFIVGALFLAFKPTSQAVKASAESAGAEFNPQHMSFVFMENGDTEIGVELSFTENLFNNLAIETVENKFLWQTTYTASGFYLRITLREDGGDGTSDIIHYFHIDPEHSVLSSRQLTLDYDNFSGTARIPLPIDFEKYYTYIFSVIETNQWGEVQSEVVATRTTRRSIGETARQILADDAGNYSDEEVIKNLNILAGYTTSTETFTVNFVYKKLTRFGYVEDDRIAYLVNSLYVGIPNVVYGSVMKLLGVSNISEFNLIVEDPAHQYIYLVARDYEYAYDPATGVGTLKLVYDDFTFDKFAIRLQDNDLLSNPDFYRYIHTYQNPSYEEKEDGTYVTLTFNYVDVMTSMAHDNGLQEGWIFELTKDSFTVENNASDHVAVYLGENEIKIKYREDHEDDLKNVAITATAQIVPDRNVSVNVHYTRLNFDDCEIYDVQETFETSMMVSELLKNFLPWNAFQTTEAFEHVQEALELPELNGQEYLIPKALTSNFYKDVTADEFNVHVNYDYNTLFKINEIYGEETLTSFVACTKNSLSYDVDDLRLRIKDGYRIQTVSADAAHVATKFDEANAEDLTLTLKTSAHEKRIIPVDVTYTDVWNVNVVYLEPWIYESGGKQTATPFAVHTIKTAQVKVGDYDFSKPLPIDDVKTLLKKDNMDLFFGGIAPDKEARAELTSASTYTVTVTYGLASLTTIDYDGNKSEIRIPMTSYADWCKAFGDDFSILFLNRQGRTYFDHSNDVAREKLYGLFSMAIFEEQVSDLNSVFKNVTGAGNIEVFQSREVKGSDTYAFFDNLRTKGPVLSAAGHIGMSFCELVNDENRIQYSHFFFLDGSAGVHDNYLSNGGATDKEDTDGATENFFQSVGGDISIWWGDLTAEFEATMKPVKIILYVTLGVAAVAAIAIGIWWIVRKVKESENGDG